MAYTATVISAGDLRDAPQYYKFLAYAEANDGDYIRWNEDYAEEFPKLDRYLSRFWRAMPMLLEVSW